MRFINGPSTSSQFTNGSVFTSLHLLECLHIDIVLEVLSFHSSCWDSKGFVLTSFLRALQRWTRAGALLYWDWEFWFFHLPFNIWVSAASFISLVCFSQVFWWCLPSLILGDLCTFFVTLCYCCVLGSVMNRCPPFAISVISTIILYFHAKLTYFQMLIPPWAFLPESSSWCETWHRAGGMKMSVW